MGHLDYLKDRFDDRQFQQGVQSDLDMLVLEKMYENTRGGRRLARGRHPHASTGRRKRGFMFWVILAICIYWFFLRPLGL